MTCVQLFRLYENIYQYGSYLRSISRTLKQGVTGVHGARDNKQNGIPFVFFLPYFWQKADPQKFYKQIMQMGKIATAIRKKYNQTSKRTETTAQK